VAQIEAAIGEVFGVDTQLIRDGTYFVVEHERRIVACGGWSRRASLFGGDRGRGRGDPELDPQADPARIRAFFVDPACARRGIASSIMAACERAIVDAGFGAAVIVSTLAGEPLYASFGYKASRRYDVEMAGGLTLPVVSMVKAFSGPVHTPQKPGAKG
jgi:GNAT superfamily N-acetyltransferase